MDQQSKEKSQDQQFRLTHPKNLIDPATGKPYKYRHEAWNAFWNKAYQRDCLLAQIKIQEKLSKHKH